jgi:transketolase
LRLDKSNAGYTRLPSENFQFGKIRTLRPGNDGAIFATGGILKTALEVSDLLEKEGRSIRVLSVHSLKPFDVETVTSVCRDVDVVLTLEEHIVDGGLGGLVAETSLEQGCPPRRFYRMGLRGGFNGIVGSQEYMRTRCGLDLEAVADRMRRLLS